MPQCALNVEKKIRRQYLCFLTELSAKLKVVIERAGFDQVESLYRIEHGALLFLGCRLRRMNCDHAQAFTFALVAPISNLRQVTFRRFRALRPKMDKHGPASCFTLESFNTILIRRVGTFEVQPVGGGGK